jgi:hypothetical protein
MLTLLIALMAGLARRLKVRVRVLTGDRRNDYVVVDPHVDGQIDHAAAQWADAHHQPAAALLVADKLRLAYVLQQRRRRRRRKGRWSR